MSTRVMQRADFWDALPEAAQAIIEYQHRTPTLDAVDWQFEQASCNNDRTLAWVHYVPPDSELANGRLLTLIAAKIAREEWSVSHLLSHTEQGT